MIKAMLFDIQHGSFVDGPGIRTTVFFKGCNLACKWCHNPEGMSMKVEKLYYRDKCTGCGKCKRICPSPEQCTFCGTCQLYCPGNAISICGREYTVDEVLKEILADRIFYGKDGGATFSGGECMLQHEFLTEILKCCKEYGIHTAVDTAGHVAFELFEKVIPYTDVFLYDLKCATEQVHREYTGVSNWRILQNLYRLKERGVRLIIRFPLIPGVNTSVEELGEMRRILDEIEPELVEVLPYHKMGVRKAAAIGTAQPEFRSPNESELCMAREMLIKERSERK